ncbi:MAG: DUF4397 domain-containing protein, partial [Myxococcales bacterium]|nr:DUF4397 domain-containing protein [Myxococcales bacterium]
GLIRAWFVVLAMLALVGCDDGTGEEKGDGSVGKDGSTDGALDGADSDAAVEGGQLRFVHASPTTGLVDLYLTAEGIDVKKGASPAAEGVGYTDIGVVDGIKTGDYSLHAYATGADPAKAERLGKITVEFSGNELESIAFLDDDDDADELPELLGLETVGFPEGMAFARIGVVHGAPELGTVDVYNVVAGDENDVLSIDDLEFGGQVTINVPSGMRQFGIETGDAQVNNDVNDEVYPLIYSSTVVSGLRAYAFLVDDIGVTKLMIYPVGASEIVFLVTPDPQD